MSEIKFKLANKNNFEEIVTHSKNWPDSPPKLNSFIKLLKTDSFYLILVDEEIVGSFSFVTLRNDTIIVQFLRVKEEFRMKWIWRKTVNFIEKIAKENGCDCILSTVLKINKWSIAFHEKMWFKKSWNIDFDNPELIFMKDI